jgi:cytoskeletal protein CcmA (bactofilin family)
MLGQYRISGTVSAGRDLWKVSTNGIAGAVSAGRDLGQVNTSDVSGSLTGGRDVYRIDAGGSVNGSISAGNHVFEVYSIWGDITGSITAGTSIGSVWTANNGKITGSITAGDWIGGVFGSGDVAGPITAGGNIYSVVAGQSMRSTIQAGQDLQSLGGYDITGTVIVGRDIGSVVARGNLITNLNAPRDIGSITAWGDVVGNVSAGRNITSVVAWNELTGNVSVGGDIGSIYARHELTGAVTSGQDIGIIEEGSYYSPSGGTDAVVTGAISAGRDIYRVTAYDGSITSSVSAGGNIGEVFSNADVTHNVTAQGSIQYVTARGNLSGDVESYVGGIDVEAGNISGNLTVPGDIKLEIIDGLTGNATSQTGKVTIDAGGDVSGAVSAEDDVEIDTYGNVSGDVTAGDASHPADVTINADEEVSGNVTASGSVTLGAGLDVTGNVTGGDVDVTAGGDVTGEVTATDSSLSIDAGGTVSGAITAQENASVSAGGDVTLSITSATGDVTVELGGDFTGSVTAPDGAYVDAQGDVGGSIAAGDADHQAGAGVFAGGTVSGTIHATDEITVEAGGDVTGTVVADQGEIDVTAGGDLTGYVYSHGGAVYATADNVSGTVFGWDFVSVSASGSVSHSVASWHDSVELTTQGSFSGVVSAAQDITADVGGDVSGSLLSASGSVWVTATGSVTYYGEVSGQSVFVQAGGDFLGLASSGAGDVTVLAGGWVGNFISSWGGNALAWGGTGVSAYVQARGEADVVSLTSFTGIINDPSGQEEVWEFNGVSGEEEMESDLHLDAGGVSALRQWYDNLPADQRQALNDQMATAWLATKSAYEAIATFLQSGKQEDDFWGYFAQRYNLNSAADLIAYQLWLNQDGPADQCKDWHRRIQVGRRMFDAVADEIKNSYDSHDPVHTDAATFQQNKAAWDQQLAQEFAASKAQADQLRQDASAYDALERQALTAWRFRASVLQAARKQMPWVNRLGFNFPGYDAPKTQEQIVLEGYVGKVARHADDPNQFPRDTNYKIVFHQDQFNAIDRYVLTGTTAEGRDQYAKWEQAKRFGRMSPIDKLELTLTELLADPHVVDDLGQSVVDALKDLAKPETLAVLAVGAGITVGVAYVGGPVGVAAVALIGYALLGAQVFDVSQEMYMGISTALNAQSNADITLAAGRLKVGLQKVVYQATQAGTIAVAATGVGVVGSRIKSAKPKPLTAQGQIGVEAKAAAAAEAEAGIVGGVKTLLQRFGADMINRIRAAASSTAEADQAIQNLETVAQKLLDRSLVESKYTKYQFQTLEEVDALLTRIFDVDQLAVNLKISPVELLNDMTLLSDTPGFVATVKNLKITGSGLKGKLYEFRIAAKWKREGKAVTGVDRPVRSSKGNTDNDIVSDGVCWQAKAGPNSVAEKAKIVNWAERNLAENPNVKLGLVLDPDAYNALNNNSSLMDVVRKFGITVVQESP